MQGAVSPPPDFKEVMIAPVRVVLRRQKEGHINVNGCMQFASPVSFLCVVAWRDGLKEIPQRIFELIRVLKRMLRPGRQPSAVTRSLQEKSHYP